MERDAIDFIADVVHHRGLILDPSFCSLGLDGGSGEGVSVQGGTVQKLEHWEQQELQQALHPTTKHASQGTPRRETVELAPQAADNKATQTIRLENSLHSWRLCQAEFLIRLYTTLPPSRCLGTDG